MTRKNTKQVGSMLVLILCLGGMASAQSDQSQPTAPPPAATFGQANSAPTVNENPPISAIDQPGLEPHASPESFLVPGLHFSESADSNQTNRLGGSSWASITRALGSLSLQRLWKNYGLATDYVGGASDYSASFGWAQMQQLDFDNRITWKRGQLGIRDAFSYLPEGTFAGGAYGGSGAFQLGLGSLGSGFLGAGGFGGQNGALFGGTTFDLGTAPRIVNLGLADVIENLTPKSAVTIAAGYSLEHFTGSPPSEFGENISFLGSRQLTGEIGYDRILTPKDQAALVYGYQAFDFSVVDTDLHTNIIQAMYGHRISGRMDFVVAAGPQFTHLNEIEQVCIGFLGIPVDVPPDHCAADGGQLQSISEGGNHLGVAGRAMLRYRFPKTALSLSFQRYETSGSGVFAGAESNIARAQVARPLSRIWDVFADGGYARNSRLQLAGATVNAGAYSEYFAGVGLHRQFGRSLRTFASYQFSELGFDTACPLAGCNNHSQRQTFTVGLVWNPRPIRLD